MESAFIPCASDDARYKHLRDLQDIEGKLVPICGVPSVFMADEFVTQDIADRLCALCAEWQFAQVKQLSCFSTVAVTWQTYASTIPFAAKLADIFQAPLTAIDPVMTICALPGQAVFKFDTHPVPHCSDYAATAIVPLCSNHTIVPIHHSHSAGFTINQNQAAVAIIMNKDGSTDEGAQLQLTNTPLPSYAVILHLRAVSLPIDTPTGQLSPPPLVLSRAPTTPFTIPTDEDMDMMRLQAKDAFPDGVREPRWGCADETAIPLSLFRSLTHSGDNPAGIIKSLDAFIDPKQPPKSTNTFFAWLAMTDRTAADFCTIVDVEMNEYVRDIMPALILGTASCTALAIRRYAIIAFVHIWYRYNAMPPQSISHILRPGTSHWRYWPRSSPMDHIVHDVYTNLTEQLMVTDSRMVIQETVSAIMSDQRHLASISAEPIDFIRRVTESIRLDVDIYVNNTDFAGTLIDPCLQPFVDTVTDRAAKLFVREYAGSLIPMAAWGAALRGVAQALKTESENVQDTVIIAVTDTSIFFGHDLGRVIRKSVIGPDALGCPPWPLFYDDGTTPLSPSSRKKTTPVPPMAPKKATMVDQEAMPDLEPMQVLPELELESVAAT
jgi:hypothetical protein